MSYEKLLQQMIGMTLVVLFLVGCGAPAASPTLVPTATPYPTYTPLPSTPTPPTTGVGEWLKGHYWSIKVVEVQTKTELDGIRPKEDVFVLVNVQSKGNNLTESHIISGSDFQLVDDAGGQYDVAGMIYEPKTYEPYTAGAKFQKGNWWWSQTSGNTDNTFRLVYDIPSSATGLRLWFQDLPLVDLGLKLP